MAKISLMEQYEEKPRKKGQYKNCPQCGGTITGNKCDYCGTVFYDVLNLSFDEPTIIRFKMGGTYKSMFVKVASIDIEIRDDIFYANDIPYHTMLKEELHIIAQVIPDDDDILHVSYDPELDPREREVRCKLKMDFDLLDNDIEIKDMMFNEIGLCGCGYYNDTVRIIYEYLKAKEELYCHFDYRRWKDFLEKFIEENKEFLYEFMCYVLDDKGFTEHGPSVGSAWITEKGKTLLRMIEEVCGEADDKPKDKAKIKGYYILGVDLA